MSHSHFHFFCPLFKREAGYYLFRLPVLWASKLMLYTSTQLTKSQTTKLLSAIRVPYIKVTTLENGNFRSHNLIQYLKHILVRNRGCSKISRPWIRIRDCSVPFHRHRSAFVKLLYQINL